MIVNRKKTLHKLFSQLENFGYLCIHLKRKAMMAQLVEQRIRNAWVAGSSPARGSLFFSKPCLHLPPKVFCLRDQHIGSARASQACEAGSTPVSRSIFDIRYRYFLYLCIRFQKDKNFFSNRYGSFLIRFKFLFRKIQVSRKKQMIFYYETNE